MVLRLAWLPLIFCLTILTPFIIRDVHKFLNENSSRIDEIDESSYMEENLPIEPPELPQRHASE